MDKSTRLTQSIAWSSRIGLWDMLAISSLLTVIMHAIAGSGAFTVVLVVSMLLSTSMLFHKTLRMWVLIPAGVVLTYSLMTLLAFISP